ncbi:hypothetical protein DYD21_09235 [Rhodohalobacter sp. SW132]|uniref:Na+/H+ antiporter subunit E n=1 Tax=Rhodohalobacter sp. SW132 TaxID=2293433 RepID=UPI000E22A5F1|nr:Na+/H+ antiporter subunit E [Rhodohalobacter sp. SW132]REL33584.1 hypothetical protein DYD21_09235 [Rhodohalobacter sp. SW132]
MHKLSTYNLTLSFISLMAFWLAMSGILDFVHILFGVITVAGVMALNYRLKMFHFFKDDMDDLRELRFWKAPIYAIWMFGQIILAGLHVLRVIGSPRMHIETTMVTFKVNLPSAHAKMILGNSITLTPGTLTIDIVGDTFTVHALDKASYEGIIDDTMPKKVLQLFENTDRPVVSDVNIQISDS